MANRDVVWSGSQPPSVELFMQQGPWPGQRLALPGPVITIGREAGNNLVISVAEVSRRHASLTWDGGHWILQDLGSANGTFVNGARLVALRVLEDGDYIGLGSSVLLGFRSLPAAVAPAAQPEPSPVVAASPGTPVPSRPVPSMGPAPAVVKGRPRRRRLVLVVAAVLGIVVLVVAALAAYLLWPRDIGGPVVLIESPARGAQVEVGQEVTVHSVARDEAEVVRVELWVDGELHEAQDSNIEGGVSPFPLVAYWQPASSGQHTLTARAFNAHGSRAQASVTVEAIGVVDRDGDGTADDGDRCPDEPGPAIASGCPDLDLDGIPDAEDPCPSEPGPPGQGGCPVPGPADGDGDGLLDEVDACPDEPGPPQAQGCPDADGDGVRDSHDACPTEGGSPRNGGCPNADDPDGDRVLSDEDQCPAAWGAPEVAGCPDEDGDGIPNPQDERPDEPAPPETAGTAETGAPDSDGDGVGNDLDRCPEEPGSPEHDGCPPPGEGEDADGDGNPDDMEEPETPLDRLNPEVLAGPEEWYLGSNEEPTWLEFQLLEFASTHSFQRVECYARLGDGDVERYELEPAGEERAWAIPAGLGSRLVAVPLGQDLEVQAECNGIDQTSTLPFVELGSFQRRHPSEDWDYSRSFTVEAEEHYAGFQATYRICEAPCEAVEASLPAPSLLGPIHYASGSTRLIVRWDGDMSLPVFMALHVNGNVVGTVGRQQRSVDIGRHAPACGETAGFQVRAFTGSVRNPDRQSPLSNIVVWEGDSCPRTVRVFLLVLETRNLRDEERSRGAGPVYGYFDVTGSTTHRLSFSGVDYGNWAWEDHTGLVLDENGYYAISGLFEQLHAWQVGCGVHGVQADCPWRAPNTHMATVELGPRDALTVGARIRDVNSGWGSRTTDLFNESRTFRPDEILPGLYTIDGGDMLFTFSIDLVEGTEGSGGAQVVPPPDRPDLRVINILWPEDSETLRVRVFNAGAPLQNSAISIRLETVDTGTLLATPSWEGISIASDSYGWLTYNPEFAPQAVRAIVDPDDHIDETDEGNNQYTMPVRMRVEFLRAWQAFCNEDTSVFQAGGAEFVFGASVGHGRNLDEYEDIEWVARGVRHPAREHLTACFGYCDSSPDAAWNMGGDRYTFEFEMPADERLLVQVSGEETDIWPNRHDPLGPRRVEYGPAENWGAQSAPHEGQGETTGSCDEAGCQRCSGGLSASWRITRLF